MTLQTLRGVSGVASGTLSLYAERQRYDIPFTEAVAVAHTDFTTNPTMIGPFPSADRHRGESRCFAGWRRGRTVLAIHDMGAEQRSSGGIGNGAAGSSEGPSENEAGNPRAGARRRAASGLCRQGSRGDGNPSVSTCAAVVPPWLTCRRSPSVYHRRRNPGRGVGL